MAENSFQDDQREREMRELFGLIKDETEGLATNLRPLSGQL